MHDKKIISVTS